MLANSSPVGVLAAINKIDQHHIHTCTHALLGCNLGKLLVKQCGVQVHVYVLSLLFHAYSIW